MCHFVPQKSELKVLYIFSKIRRKVGTGLTFVFGGGGSQTLVENKPDLAIPNQNTSDLQVLTFFLKSQT